MLSVRLRIGVWLRPCSRAALYIRNMRWLLILVLSRSYGKLKDFLCRRHRLDSLRRI